MCCNLWLLICHESYVNYKVYNGGFYFYLILFVFLQTIQYITRSKVIETETRELSSISRGKIKYSETDDWKNEKLFVPPLPPTNLRGCHLIRIQYDVFVSVYSLFTISRYRTRAIITRGLYNFLPTF